MGERGKTSIHAANKNGKVIFLRAPENHSREISLTASTFGKNVRKNVGMPADKEEGERPIYSLLVHCLGELLGHESFEFGSEVFLGVGELDILFPISSQRRQGTY